MVCLWLKFNSSTPSVNITWIMHIYSTTVYTCYNDLVLLNSPIHNYYIDMAISMYV